LVVLVVVFGMQGKAQQVTATLSGTVSDPSGALVPDAQLTATNVNTGVAVKTISDPAGNYIFPSLPSGTYSLSAGKSGFKSTVISSLTLEVYQKATINVVLQVGSVAQSVEVKGAAPMVNTTSASIGAVVEERAMVDLPLNLRRTSSLALLVPGVSDTSGYSLTSSSGNGSGFNTTSFSAAGGASSSNLVLVDGMPNRALNNGGFALDLPPEMVKEFNIQNNVYDAPFGVAAGSVMNTITQSGTSQFHGSTWEYVRNQKLDARNYFALNQTNPVTGAEIPGTARPSYIRNQFGFALGGPIRKEKTFFFVSYEGLRFVQGSTSLSVVPTAAEKRGDFSAYLTGQTANLCGAGGPTNLNFDTGQIFYPATEYLFTCPSGSTVLAGQPIPNNLITALDPFAQKVLPTYPAPNYPIVSGFNYINNTPYRESDNTGLVRIDETLSPRNQLFGHYIIGRSEEFYPGNFNPFNDSQYYQGQNFVLGWTHTFGPDLLNDARIGYARGFEIRNCSECPHPPGTLASFGIQDVAATSPQTEIDPQVTLVNFAAWGDGSYNPDVLPDAYQMIGDALTKIHGRHSLAVGGTFYFFQLLGYEDPAQLNGLLNFNGQYSSLAGTIPNVSTISDLADLELGYPGGSPAGMYMEHAFVNNFIGGGWFNLFAQDNIRVRSRLSLELGLRWEYRKQPHDKHNLIATLFPLSHSFTPGDALLLTGLPDAANDALCSQPYFISASGECLVMTSAERVKYGFTGGKRSEVSLGGGWDSFAPRLGVSWRPSKSDKLVVHAGAGLFYDLPETNQLVAYNNNNFVFAPTLLYFPGFGSPPPTLPSGAATTTETMFATSGALQSLSSVTGQLMASPFYFTPTVYEWSATADSQFAANWALEVGYIGNRAVHTDIYHTYANMANPTPLNQAVVPVWPDFGQFVWNTYDGISNYNALTARLTKRLSQGFSALFSYTWAKEMDYNGGDSSEETLLQNDNDPRADYSPGDVDTGQRFVASPIWQLPFGNGQRFLNRHGVVNSLAGGWELSGIITFQTGLPFTILSPEDFSNSLAAYPRPDRICNGRGPGTVAEFFNTDCFTTTFLTAALANGTPRYGNAGRSILFGPNVRTADIALMKHTKISERFDLQFRAQFFNMFNRVNFSLPGAIVGSSTYGVIGGARDGRTIQFGLKAEF